MKIELKILYILIFIAFVIRIIALWFARPEFVGWFNHTHYYYVQTQGILQNGGLPFADMPLLFYIYAGTSKLLTFIGIELTSAIRASTKLWMSLIPSLLPIPIYLTIKNIFKGEPLPKWIWIFICASAFYPASILFMPEFLQKNTLGLLLFSFFIWQSTQAFSKASFKRLITLGVLFLLIVLTHYGTTAITLLYIASITITFLLQKSKKTNVNLILGLFSGLSIALITFYFVDIQRFNRVGFYINRITDNSSLGRLFSPEDSNIFVNLFIIIIPILLVVLLFKWYNSVRTNLNNENNLFWLVNIIFFYLLILPIYDPSLLGRFAIFLALPIFFILIFMLKYYISKTWLKKLVLGFIVMFTLGIGFSDMAKAYSNRQINAAIFKDLMNLKDKVGFNKNDLIITRNGVEHISIWFLNTKSSILTSFNKADFQKYNRVFILNPEENGMKMLRNIQVPSNAVDIYNSEHIKLYQLKFQPVEWEFNDIGNWINYKEE